jgi:hypothetical protein
MPPRNGRGGPGRPPEPASEITSTATTEQQGTAPTPARIRRGGKPKPPVPVAVASVFGPVGRRKSWWFTFRCPTCGAYLFGRAAMLDTVTRERKATCGHRVKVVAARIYTQPPGAAT